MPKKKLLCFIVEYKGGAFRLAGHALSVHATSYKHAMRLLKAVRVKGFRYFHGLYVQRHQHCDADGTHCYYRLLAKPSYDKTPLGFVKCELPKPPARPKAIPPQRQAVIDKLIESRPDLYD